ncbi:MAG: (d)CMP kinase [Rickettsiales bacterium]|jgi:cytidylate kinase|nr:(d)CMP kinase [Rickettsiales bacterium]
MTENKNIIAIDGPSGSGKGTLRRALCEHYRFAGLDTGSLYRAITLYLIRHGYDMDHIDPSETARVARGISASHEILEYAADPDVRSMEVSLYVAIVATNPELRRAIRQYQIDFGRNPPPLPDGMTARGAVIEGRDIGTVIFPDAPVKIYITATPEVKARRRYDEYVGLGIKASYDEILANMLRRDELDSKRDRDAGQLSIASDAVVIDTSDMTREQVAAAAIRIADERLPK